MLKLQMQLMNAWRSKTVLFNGALLAMLPLFELAQLLLPEIRPLIPDDIYMKMGVVSAVGNMLLRFLTKQPLEHK